MGPHPGRTIKRKKSPFAKPQSEAKGAARTPASPTPRAETGARAASPPRAAYGPAKAMSEAEAEKIARARERRDAALSWLRTTFPLAFDARRPKPLKLDVRADIWLAAKGRTPFPDARDSLGLALAYHCRSKNYLYGLARPGAHRCDLDGRPIEAVSAEHRALAQSKLDEIEQARGGRQAGGRGARREGPPDERQKKGRLSRGGPRWTRRQQSR